MKKLKINGRTHKLSRIEGLERLVFRNMMLVVLYFLFTVVLWFFNLFGIIKLNIPLFFSFVTIMIGIIWLKFNNFLDLVLRGNE